MSSTGKTPTPDAYMKGGNGLRGTDRQRSMLSNPHDEDSASRIPLVYQRIVVALFVVGMSVAVLFVAFQHWRRGSFVMGTSMVWLAIARATCDSETLGVLSVRSRRFDVVFCFTVGLVVLYLAVSMDAMVG